MIFSVFSVATQSITESLMRNKTLSFLKNGKRIKLYFDLFLIQQNRTSELKVENNNNC
jgi:hypothetical protein